MVVGGGWFGGKEVFGGELVLCGTLCTVITGDIGCLSLCSESDRVLWSY
jgi:hypothetical protein